MNAFVRARGETCTQTKRTFNNEADRAAERSSDVPFLPRYEYPTGVFFFHGNEDRVYMKALGGPEVHYNKHQKTINKTGNTYLAGYL